MENKKTATFLLTEKLSAAQKSDICRELDFHGKVSFSIYSCVYEGDLVEIENTATKIKIAITFDKFEYSFLRNRKIEGEII